LSKLLLTPGPVTLRSEVLEALSTPAVSHRGDEFHRVFASVLEGLARIYRTADRITILTGSGTLAVDAMVYSLVNPGEKVLLINHGVFGDRMLRTLEIRGACVKVLKSEPGEPVNPDLVMNELEKGIYDVLALVYTETSTGLTYRIARKIALKAKDLGALVIVDAVSALGGEYLGVSDFGFDAVASCSQKALATPPGLSFVALSTEGVDKVFRTYKKPPYLDLALYLKFHEKLETPTTPAVNLLYALNVALEIILKEGLEKWIKIHEERAKLLYTALPSANLNPLVREPYFRSNTVTVFKVPNGIKASNIVKYVAKNGYIISTGMGNLKEKVIRIGTMGNISLDNLKDLVTIISNFINKQ